MEVIKNMRFADFEVLKQAQGRVSRGKAAAGEKSGGLRDQKVSEWMYTEPGWEARNGNPDSNREQRERFVFQSPSSGQSGTATFS
jgi:hypothetical protein